MVASYLLARISPRYFAYIPPMYEMFFHACLLSEIWGTSLFGYDDDNQQCSNDIHYILLVGTDVLHVEVRTPGRRVYLILPLYVKSCALGISELSSEFIIHFSIEPARTFLISF